MKALTLFLALLAAFASASVFGGAATSANVVVTMNADGTASASGDMVAARTAPNDNELIGCGIKGFKSGSPDFGFCQAADAEGNYLLCTTFKANLISMVNAIADYSFVRFDVDAKGECTRIDFSTQSFYLPSNITN